MTRDNLIAQLARLLGRRAAALEYRWMRDLARHSTDTLHSMVQRRLRHEPLQYILGSQPFGPLDLKVRAPVLIPRPETEDWTLRLSRLLRSSRSPSCQAPLNILDLCTGTGCIPLLLSHLSPPGTVRVLAVDVASEAVTLARENAELAGVRISEGGIRPQDAGSGSNSISVLEADILKADFPLTLKELGWPSFDVMTCNPPYIPLDEYNALPTSVKDYEDPRALLGDPDPQAARGGGLTFYRTIAELVHGGLVKRDGVIALEVGHQQSEDVQQLMRDRGHVRRTEVWKDAWGVERTVVCWK